MKLPEKAMKGGQALQGVLSATSFSEVRAATILHFRYMLLQGKIMG